MSVGTRLFQWMFGECVGKDQYGNCYYQERKEPKDRRRKRWVYYEGVAEPSKVPPEWHMWLHYTVDELPEDSKYSPKEWEKEHIPNLTGTAGAYYPPGHITQGGKREDATGDYEAWRP